MSCTDAIVRHDDVITCRFVPIGRSGDGAVVSSNGDVEGLAEAVSLTPKNEVRKKKDREEK